jgi:hypothetical protein
MQCILLLAIINISLAKPGDTEREMEQQPDQQRAAGAQPPLDNANTAGGNVKLGVFWPHAPALWFSQAECQFLVKGVSDSFTRYCHVVAVLPHESLRLVADLVKTPPEQEPYQTLKDRLLASHQLTRYQEAFGDDGGHAGGLSERRGKKPTCLRAFFCSGCPGS